MKRRRKYDKKKIAIAIILVVVVLAIALLLVIKSCDAKTDEAETTESTTVTTEATTVSNTTAATTEATTAAQSGKKADEVITTKTFVSLTGSKDNLVDKGNYYELSVSVNEKDSSGNIVTTGTDTIKISKNAVVTWYEDSSNTINISLDEYFTMTDYLRIFYSDFNGSVIYAKDSNGYVIAFFDGLFQ